MKGVDKSRDTENVVTAQSSEMNSPFFHTYDTLHVLLEILDGEIKCKSSVRCEWVIVLLNELGGVCLRVSVRGHGVHEEVARKGPYNILEQGCVRALRRGVIIFTSRRAAR